MTTNNSLIKALSLLELFTTENPVIGLNEIVKLSGLPKATVHRMLISLEKSGFLSRSSEYDGDRRYRLGIKLFELGMKVYNEIEITKIAIPIMKKLRDETGEAVQLAVREGEGILYIEKIDTEHIYRLFTAKGVRGPLHSGASGQLLFSSMDDFDINLILSKPFNKYTEKSPSSKTEVLDKLKFVRENGYCVSVEELWPGTVEIAAPIYDSEGKMAAAVSIAGPLVRISRENIKQYIELVKASAEKISHDLGFNPTMKVSKS